MLNSYYTIQKQGMSETIIQKSRFITSIARASNEEAAREFISKIKEKYPDATHNCSAYVIGEHDETQKANDDGEPSGTAGVPMLNVLLKQSLKNTVVVVTRYFGGKKLGAGGLIRAYSSSVSECIQQTGIVRVKKMYNYKLKCSYEQLGKIENELHSTPHTIITIDYGADVTIHVQVFIEEKDTFEEWIINLTNGRVSVSQGEVSLAEERTD